MMHRPGEKERTMETYMERCMEHLEGAYHAETRRLKIAHYPAWQLPRHATFPEIMEKFHALSESVENGDIFDPFERNEW